MLTNLPTNWVETDVKAVSNIYRGISYNKSQTTSHFVDASVYVLRGGNIQDGKIDFDTDDNVYVDRSIVSDIQLIRKDDVVIVGSTGSKTLIGKAGIADRDLGNVGFGAFLMLLRTNVINPKFYSYFFLTKYYRDTIRELAGGVNINNIRKEYLENLVFPLPPLAEQERIIAKLEKLFAQHEAMKTALDRIPKLLKDFKQQLLTQAVTGKLTEEWRKGKVFENFSLDSVNDILKIENAILNEENSRANRSKHKINPFKFLRQNNFKWSFFTIESLCVAIVDCLHETAKFSENGFKIIDTNNIEAFKVNEAKLRYVDSEIYIKWISRLKPEYGDVVFTREGTIGKALMITENDSYCIGQRTMIFRFSKLLNSRFCELYLNSEPLKKQYRHLIKGVASQHLNIKDIRLLEIPLPSLEEQKEIVTRMESLFAKADKIEERYKALKNKLATLPQAILHKAFKGELVERLPTDGNAKDLLTEIMSLKNELKKKK